MVRAAKEYIAAGDIFQVVLSQRLSRETEADPFTIYRALRMLNPSPYMFFLDFSGMAGIGRRTACASSAPARRCTCGWRMARPTCIPSPARAGAARRRRRTHALADDLLADPKERAEHVMLVDLGRNDLGRVCEYGTVTVPTMMAGRTLQPRHAHRQRRARQDAARARRLQPAARHLPGRHASAARPRCGPWRSSRNWKAMRRGPYAGAVGYIGNDGTMDTCITIRTIVMQGKTCHLQAGGGIVADSDPTLRVQRVDEQGEGVVGGGGGGGAGDYRDWEIRDRRSEIGGPMATILDGFARCCGSQRTFVTECMGSGRAAGSRFDQADSWRAVGRVRPIRSAPISPSRMDAITMARSFNFSTTLVAACTETQLLAAAGATFANCWSWLMS